MRNLLIPLLMVTLGASCQHQQTTTNVQRQPTHLVILHTNDTHGYIWGNEETGTVAQRAHVINEARQEVTSSGGVVLLLDAGDVRTGTYCSDTRRSEPDLEAMDAMGYDAMVVGNHEFDVNYSVVLQQRELVSFPILGANVLSAETGESLLDPAVVIERGGLRIAIIGLVTSDSATTSTNGADPALRFGDPTSMARHLVERLRPQADLVVVLSHLGLEEDRRLAHDVDGIDVIIGGHSHDVLEHPIVEGSTVIAQAGDYGRFVGRVDLAVGDDSVELQSGRLLRITPDLPSDPAVTAVLERYACDEASEVIVELTEDVTREPLAGPGTSSTLSNLVSDALRSVAGADVSLVNRGGLRADLSAGPVTAADVHAVLPFDNRVVVVEATGEDLVAIARSVHSRGPDGRGVLFTSGMRFIFGPSDRVQVMVGGQPADPTRRYTLALSAFIAEGGDGHEPITRLTRVRELSETSAAAFSSFLRSSGEVTLDREARTVWLSSDGPSAPSPKSVRSLDRRGRTGAVMSASM